jgi:hypothetical protein
MRNPNNNTKTTTNNNNNNDTSTNNNNRQQQQPPTTTSTSTMDSISELPDEWSESKPGYNTSLNDFMDGSSFLQASNSNGSAWGRFLEDDDDTIGTGKSFPSTFEMGDMVETSERSRPLSISNPPSNPFAINAVEEGM